MFQVVALVKMTDAQTNSSQLIKKTQALYHNRQIHQIARGNIDDA